MLNYICGMPDDPNADWEVGLIDGQLLAHGGSRALILAVMDGHESKIREALHEESGCVAKT